MSSIDEGTLLDWIDEATEEAEYDLPIRASFGRGKKKSERDKAREKKNEELFAVGQLSLDDSGSGEEDGSGSSCDGEGDEERRSHQRRHRGRDTDRESGSEAASGSELGPERAPAPPQKRGRGRPRKYAPPVVNAPLAPKRGPGRPRKEAPPVTTPVTPKRGRGRPRKDAQPVATERESSSNLPTVSSQPVSSTAGNQEVDETDFVETPIRSSGKHRLSHGTSPYSPVRAPHKRMRLENDSSPADVPHEIAPLLSVELGQSSGLSLRRDMSDDDGGNLGVGDDDVVVRRG